MSDERLNLIAIFGYFLFIPPPLPPSSPPPPANSNENSNSPFPIQPLQRSELVPDWLNFLQALVKPLRRLLFRISIMVGGVGGVKSVGGVDRKGPIFL